MRVATFGPSEWQHNNGFQLSTKNVGKRKSCTNVESGKNSKNNKNGFITEAGVI